MPGQHAKLSPSSADRWISCPASIRMTREHGGPKDDESSPYAMEGTIAHELGEIEAGHTFGLIDRLAYHRRLKAWRAGFDAMKYDEGTLEEMQEHVRNYVLFIAQRLKRYTGSRVKLEQRLDTGVPESWGTSDVVIYGPKHIEIIDLKYGLGIQVFARGNSQLRLYACGALDAFGDLLETTEEVYITVFQPRLDWHDTDVMTPEALRLWRDDVAIPKALETQSPSAAFGPSEKACQWCPVAGICRVRMTAAAAADFGPLDEDLVFPEPEVLTPEELDKLLHRLDDIEAWTKSVAKHALNAAYSQGQTIPGWKVVKSGGKRSITDHEGMIEALGDMGYKHDEIVTMKAKPIGVLEKLVTKATFAKKLEQYVTKGDGSMALVPETDKRDAITSVSAAAADFEGDD